MEAFFQLNGCVKVGVCPRGAQVRRTLGVRLSADSSKKTRQALRRWGLLDPRPVVLDPLVDRRLVALGGAACRPLHRPAEPVAQQPPDVGGVVADAGEPLDAQRDAVDGPQLADEAAGRRAGEQCPLDLRELLVGQPWRRAAGAFAAQRLTAAGLEAAMPDADGLGGDAEPAGDLGLVDAGGEQLGRAQPAGLEPVALSLCRWAARDGCHARDPHPPSSPAAQHQLDPGTHQPNTQDPLTVVC
jgi:hypothetical protein